MTELAAHTTIRLGGPAEEFAEARTQAELVSLASKSGNGKLFVLGGGSNVLIADTGIGGRTLKVGTRGVERVRKTGTHQVLRVQAGESWDAVATRTVHESLAGIECLVGIPGTVGAAPVQNVGAYGQSISEVIVAVEVFDRLRRTLVRMAPGQCQFGYRTSVFKANPDRYVVIAVEIALEQSTLSQPIRSRELAARLAISPGERVGLGDARAAVLSLRRKKGMVIDPGDSDTCSLGSFFTNPKIEATEIDALQARAIGACGEPPALTEPGGSGEVRVPAAWMIERAGFAKGDGGRRGIGISGKHVLALVNRGGGSAAETVTLAGRIATRVWEVFGVVLSPEPDFIGHSWSTPVQPERP